MSQRNVQQLASSGQIAASVVQWQKRHGRNNLPWQKNPSPYAVWLSEIMLQQTQVSTVMPYYLKFIARFPNIQTLARADEEEVMRHWSGLGYYARARNLHKTAAIIAVRGFPQTADEWARMPGVGKSTAAAIAVFSCGQRAAILDGNVKRVLARLFAVQTLLQNTQTTNKLWQLSETLLPANTRIIRPYTQGMMDLGATICTRRRPQCALCPLQNCCLAKKLNLQDTLPHRAVAKSRPTKQKYMALVIYRGKVLLHKRPPRGIWGGLHSLPEDDNVAALLKHCQQLLGCALSPLPTNGSNATFNHQFTHFQLQAQVLILKPSGKNTPRLFQTADYQWTARRKLLDAPLPAPIKKFFAQLPLFVKH